MTTVGAVYHDGGMKHAAMLLIKLYRRFISPIKPKSCRFEPTCSLYAAEAYEKWGFFAGTALAVIRLIRCSPLTAPGSDPIPPPIHKLG